jgi:hypothetical protein
MGAVHLTVQGSVMTSNVVTPKAWVNGYPVAVKYGENVVPVPAGPVRVELSNQWLRTYGQAAIEFPLQAGQTVPVFYAAPWHQFTTGSIGFQKVKRKGAAAFAALMVLIIAIPVTVLTLSAFVS